MSIPTSDEILKELGRIEEIAVWLVCNDLFTATASLKLMPNSTPISIQDILDFVKVLHGFFPLKEIENLPPTALLKKPYVHKLFLVINFNLNRNLNKFHEYTAIYATSWGEFYCRTFSDEKGLFFVEDVVTAVKEQLELPFFGGEVGYFIPQSLRKRVRTSNL